MVMGGYEWLLVGMVGYGWLWVVMGGYGWLWELRVKKKILFLKNCFSNVVSEFTKKMVLLAVKVGCFNYYFLCM